MDLNLTLGSDSTPAGAVPELKLNLGVSPGTAAGIPNLQLTAFGTVVTTGLPVLDLDPILLPACYQLAVPQFSVPMPAPCSGTGGGLTFEADPVFLLSPAATITGMQLAQWAEAYSWGNHATAGYLTQTLGDALYYPRNSNPAGYLTSFSETDPTVPVAVKAITAGNIADWTTAFSWGNHANAGYLTGASAALLYYPLASNPANYLTGITNAQVLTALGYTPYNTSNPAGYISGITGTMVVTALGYTPYNGGTNPNGYLTSAALTGYVPYTGATGGVNLGSQTLAAGVTTLTTTVGSYTTETNLTTTAWTVNTNTGAAALYFRVGGALQGYVQSDNNATLWANNTVLPHQWWIGGVQYMSLSSTAGLALTGRYVQTGSITAASAIARGGYFNNTLVAAANGDVLVGLDISNTFTLGTFTGTTRLGLRVTGASSLDTIVVRKMVTGTSVYQIGKGAVESTKITSAAARVLLIGESVGTFFGAGADVVAIGYNVINGGANSTVGNAFVSPLRGVFIGNSLVNGDANGFFGTDSVFIGYGLGYSFNGQSVWVGSSGTTISGSAKDGPFTLVGYSTETARGNMYSSGFGHGVKIYNVLGDLTTNGNGLNYVTVIGGGASNYELVANAVFLGRQNSDDLYVGRLLKLWLSTTDPTTTLRNGALYYNSTNHLLKAYINGAWGTVITATTATPIVSTAKGTFAALNYGSTVVPTSSADATGVNGDRQYDGTYEYRKVAGQWLRSAVWSTF